MLPKSTAWDHVYEWTNYRLAGSLLNSRKGAAADVLDPFEVQDGWFLLETVEYQLVPSPNLSPTISKAVLDTIARLGLNDPECCEARGEFAADYLTGHIGLDYLSRHAPFVARELRRQGQLLPGDT